MMGIFKQKNIKADRTDGIWEKLVVCTTAGDGSQAVGL